MRANYTFILGPIGAAVAAANGKHQRGKAASSAAAGIAYAADAAASAG